MMKLIGPVTGLLDKFIEDKDQKNALAHEIATMSQKYAQEIAQGQMAINQVEAAHKSLFISGWRPALGWVRCTWDVRELHHNSIYQLCYGAFGDRHNYPAHTFRDHDAYSHGNAGVRWA